MPIFRGSKDATISSGDIVATQADIAEALTLAEQAQAAAEAAQAAAEAALDNFDDRYLGAKTSDPSVDNDGDPLIDGALYYNTVNVITRVYDVSEGSWSDLKPSATEQTNINTVAVIASDVTTVADIDTDVTTVAGISGNVTTVSGISSDVTTVSGIASDVTTVANDGTDIGTVAINILDVNTVAGIDADVSTVAGISSDVTLVSAIDTDVSSVAAIDTDVTTVASISGNVSDVSSISTDVTTVAGISTDVTTVAANIADVTNFADVYLGPASTDPATRNDGSALLAGDLYFNTTDDRLKVYSGTEWQVSARLDFEIRDLFSAAGDLTYNSSTGEFSVTTYKDADVDAHLTGGTGVTYTSGDISIGQDVGTNASVTFSDATFTGTTAIELPEGTEAQRPGTPAAGMIRFNSDVSSFEGYDGTAWGEIGGGGSDDAIDISYDNSSSGLTATDVQNAIDETYTRADVFTANDSRVKTATNATGSAPIYACRAWVNFEGISPLIRDSGNVSSITDNGTGDFTINFTFAIEDTNYAFLFDGQLDGTFNNDTGAFGTKRSDYTGGKLTTSIRVICHSNQSLTQEDPLYFTGAIFR